MHQSERVGRRREANPQLLCLLTGETLDRLDIAAVTVKAVEQSARCPPFAKRKGIGPTHRHPGFESWRDHHQVKEKATGAPAAVIIEENNFKTCCTRPSFQ